MFSEDYHDKIHDAFLDIFDNLPLFARTENRIIASHASFPKNRDKKITETKNGNADFIISTIWGDPVDTLTYRGELSKISNFSESDLISFLKGIGCNMFIRGHDYKPHGYSMYDKNLFTVITSSQYKHKDSKVIQIVNTKLDWTINDVDDLFLMEIDNKIIRKKNPHLWV